ncbi:hypothetical protein AMK59_3962 [Oryctes borbonicus]|uniref:Uncharacterized protein n=1 Tax=Oryctes borbonicus TaxID=1629725 RepID=A0A0T6B4H7_9SCAR|nr:hypothetical protein AMK59_3962 [Oryctes borbonicus]
MFHIWKGATTNLFCIFCICLAKVEHNYYWRQYRGKIPLDAFNAAENLYVAQLINQWLMPGTFNATTKEAYSEQGSRLTVTDNFKILCDFHSDNFYWEKVNIYDLVGSNLNDLVVGGSEFGATLYVGKVFHDGEWKIGKVFAPLHLLQGLRVWDDKNQRHVAQNFEVLKYRERHKIEDICNCNCAK